MAEQTQQKDQAENRQANGGDSNGGNKAMRAAAIAAATGAAAIAAKKAFSGRDQSGEGKSSGSKQSSGNDSTLVAMASSGWSAAKDSLVPFAEEAAGAAGSWVGRNGPDYIVETIVPRFIDGFESARSSDQS
jgi:hypothetical protein